MEFKRGQGQGHRNLIIIPLIICLWEGFKIHMSKQNYWIKSILFFQYTYKKINTF